MEVEGRQTAVHRQVVKLYWIRLLGVGLLLVLAAAFILIVCPPLLLHHWIEPKLEQKIAATRPGLRLQLNGGSYQLRRNRLSWRSLELTNTLNGLSCRGESVSIQGLQWRALLRTDYDRLLAKAVLTATNLLVELPNSVYRINGASLYASVPAGQAVLSNLALGPRLNDEAFFAGSPYRRTRFHFKADECAIQGWDAKAMFAGQAYKAKSVRLDRPMLDTLRPLDKPLNPNPPKPTLIQDLTKNIHQSIDLHELILTNGLLEIDETISLGAPVASLVFADASLRAADILTHSAKPIATVIQTRAKLMNRAELNLSFTLATSDGVLEYTGVLGTMDLRALNPFLTTAAHTRIRSGILKEASFAATVRSDVVRGTLHGAYQDLQISLLNRETLTEDGVMNRLKSFFADHLVLRTSNPSEGSPAVGRIDYERQARERELHFLWFAVRNGILDLIGLSDFVKSTHPPQR